MYSDKKRLTWYIDFTDYSSSFKCNNKKAQEIPIRNVRKKSMIVFIL